MLSLLRARIAHPATTTRFVRLASSAVAGTGANANGSRFVLQSIENASRLAPLSLNAQNRSFVSSAQLYYPAAKKPATKPKAKTTTAAKKKPVKKAAPKKKKKTIAVKPKKPKKKAVTRKPKPNPAHSRERKQELGLKRPISPYLIFATKYFSASTKPKASLQDGQTIAKESARVWKSFSETEKQPFVNEFNTARAEFVKKRMAWGEKVLKNRSTFLAINRDRAKMKKQRIHLPKELRRPVTGYARFLMEVSPTLTGSFGEKSKEVGARWKALSEKEKEMYHVAARKELEAWKKLHGLPL